MDRRHFLLGLTAAGLAAGGAHAQDRDQMRKRWDDMDHDSRSNAMERMRGRRHEPKYEDMRERWDKMSPADRQKMMRHHERRHGKTEKKG